MKKILTLKRTAVLFIGVLGLLWLLDRIGFSTIGSMFQRVGIKGAMVILACGLAEALLDGLALRQAALGRVPYFSALAINQTGAFLNMAAPVEAGEVLKAALLSRHLDAEASTAVLVWNMAARLAKSSVIFVAAGAALFFLPPFRSRSAVLLGFASLNLLVYAAFALILRFGGVGRTFRLLSRLPFLKGRRTEGFVSRVEEAERATSRFGANIRAATSRFSRPKRAPEARAWSRPGWPSILWRRDILSFCALLFSPAWSSRDTWWLCCRQGSGRWKARPFWSSNSWGWTGVWAPSFSSPCASSSSSLRAFSP